MWTISSRVTSHSLSILATVTIENIENHLKPIDNTCRRFDILCFVFCSEIDIEYFYCRVCIIFCVWSNLINNKNAVPSSISWKDFGSILWGHKWGIKGRSCWKPSPSFNKGWKVIIIQILYSVYWCIYTQSYAVYSKYVVALQNWNLWMMKHTILY